MTSARILTVPTDTVYSQILPFGPTDSRSWGSLPLEVHEALQAFASSSKPGVWPILDKATLLQQIRDRLTHPFRVNQGSQPFCGPAAIAFELVRQRPYRYVRLCQDLFEQGFWEGARKTISATERLRTSQGEFRMAQVDWLLLATLRDAENQIFEVDPKAPLLIRNLSGITKSWEIMGWAREVLGYGRIEYRPGYLWWGDVEGLRQARRAIDQGGVAFLLITADRLLKKSGLPVTVPNHWVTLVGVEELPGRLAPPSFLGSLVPRRFRGNPMLRFQVYSWGRRFQITVPESVWDDHFWGVVIAQD